MPHETVGHDVELAAAQLSGVQELAARAVRSKHTAMIAAARRRQAESMVAAVRAARVVALSDPEASRVAVAFVVFVIAASLLDVGLLREFGVAIIHAPEWVQGWLGYVAAAIASILVVTAECVAGGILASRRRSWPVRVLVIGLLILVPASIVSATNVARWGSWSEMTAGHKGLTVALVLLTAAVHLIVVLAAEAGVIPHLRARWELRRAKHRLKVAEAAEALAHRDGQVARVDLELNCLGLPEPLRSAAIDALRDELDAPVEQPLEAHVGT